MNAWAGWSSAATGEHLIAELDRLAEQRGTYPAALRCDNGPELACSALADWAAGKVGLHFIPPGEPWRNGCPARDDWGPRRRLQRTGGAVRWVPGKQRVVGGPVRDCRRRGMCAPVLAVGDGALGFWKAVRDVFPETKEQRCWWHKIGNVLAALPKSAHPGAKKAMAEICNAENKAEAIKAAKAFANDYGAKWPKAVAKISDDLDVLLASSQPRPSIGCVCHHQSDDRLPRPFGCGPASPKAPAHELPGSRWHSNSSNPPSPAGARSTPHIWSPSCAPERNSRTANSSNVPTSSPRPPPPKTMFGADGRAFHRPLAISVAGLMLPGVGLAVTALVLAVAHRETGQALAYIPIAIALTGVAVMVLRGTRWVIRVIIVGLAGQLAAIAGTTWELSHGIDARKASQLRQLGFDQRRAWSST